MKIISSFLLLFLSLGPTFGQYCTDVGPTSLADSNVETLMLIGDASSINYTGCPAMLGLDNQTNLSATLTAGSTYTITAQFGTCGGNYSGIGEVWIDFDQNNVFDLNESIGTWMGTPPTAPSTISFTVPINSINGTCRLRIIQREGGSLPIDPCGVFQWGSATDFSIEITGGVDCSGYSGNTQEDAITVASVPYSNTIDNAYCYFNNNPVYESPDVYFLLNPGPLVHSVTVSLCGSSFDTFLSVFDKHGNTIAFNDDSEYCESQSEVNFNISGRDSILIIVEGWGNEQGVFDINITGEFLSTDEQTTEKISIYPNPANHFIYIEGIISQDVKIFNAMGKLVQISRHTVNNPISIIGLAPGFYMASFQVDGKTKTQSLIVN